MASLFKKRNSSRGAGHFFWRDFWWGAAGSLFFYLSFPNLFSLRGYPFFIYFFAVFFLKACEAKNLLGRLLVGLFFGVFSYGLLVHWIFPIDGRGYLLFVFALASQVILFAAFYRADFSREWVNMLFPPALWVATEYGRAWALGGFAWAIGYSQTFVPPLIQIMDVAGAYGVSFFILLINVCVYRAWLKKKKIVLYCFIALVSFAAVIFYGHQQKKVYADLPVEKQISVCAVQPQISLAEKLNPNRLADSLEKHIVLSEQCAAQGAPDLILWPEIAVPDDFIRHGWIFEKVTGLAGKLETPLILGSALLLEGKDFNSAILIDAQGQVSDVYHKQFLIPFSEYNPLPEQAYFKKMFYQNKFDFQPGHNPGLFTFRKKIEEGAAPVPFGVVICSEEFYPGLFRQIGGQGVCFIATLLNDGWFRRPEALMMHAQAAVAQAVSFRKPVVRGSNTGWSVAINAQGEAIDFQEGFHKENLRLNQRGVFLFNVSCKKTKSFYSQKGDIFSFLCLLFVVTVITMRFFLKDYVKL